MIYLVSVREYWGTEIGDSSKVMLGFACVPLADRCSLSPSRDILTSELPLHPCPTAGTTFQSSRCACHAELVFPAGWRTWAAPQELQLLEKEPVLGISIALNSPPLTALSLSFEVLFQALQFQSKTQSGHSCLGHLWQGVLSLQASTSWEEVMLASSLSSLAE